MSPQARVALALAFALRCNESRADELALLELLLDGRSTHRVEAFVLRDGNAFARRSVWRDLGVRVDPGADGDDMITATQLPGVDVRLDLERRTLALSQPPDPSAVSVIDRGTRADTAALDHGSGALMNYDLTHQHGRGQHVTAALLEGRWFSPTGVLDHSMVASDLEQVGSRRLNTTFTRSDPQRMERLRFGDVVTGGLSWVRPLRLAGVQLASDFTLRPDLVTSPTPLLSGSTAVPTTVDVLVNGVRQLSEPVAPGRFEVRQLPMVNGLGEVSVVTRDVLGRESVQTLAFYASNRQLASGVSAYAIDAGLIRQGYATSQDRYAGAATTATWRHGLTQAVTFETHGEVSRGTVVAGAGALINLGFGLLSGSLAGSAGQGRRGWLASVGAERQTSGLSLGLSLTAATADFRDVATTQGDASLRLNAQAGAAWQLGRMGSVAVAVVVQHRDPTMTAVAQRARIISATYTRTFFADVQAYLSAYRDAGSTSSNAISIGVTIPFGGRGAASSWATRGPTGSLLSAVAGESATLTGETGWRAQTDAGFGGNVPSRQVLQVSHLASAARVTAEAEQFGSTSAVRFGAQGAVLMLGSGLHATQTVADSVALVDVDGQPGVSVFHQNRFIGRTDSHGELVVPGLLSFQRNKLSIEPLDIPLDAEPDELAREVRPADRSALRVRFALDRQRAALVVLRDAKGEPLPVGALVRDRDQAAERAVVGYDGEAYVRGLGDDNQLSVDWGSGRCTARVLWNQRQGDTGRIGLVPCV